MLISHSFATDLSELLQQLVVEAHVDAPEFHGLHLVMTRRF
jgi:hypothetical protein